MHIKKNDTVIVISGIHKGKEGKILKVLKDENKVIVEGINLRKRHMKPTQQNPQGGIQEKEIAIHASKVMLMYGGKRTRVGHKILEDGRKVRVARANGEVVD
ncbi:MAG: 50S ribosomal protein L24 [Bacteroidetes bacterium]|nr:50S ribosomal protein L24 [Bacteroidota bacterium]